METELEKTNCLGDLSARLEDYRKYTYKELNRAFGERLAKIVPVNEDAKEAVYRRWQEIAKPLGSLGLLEDDIMQIAGITGNPEVSLDKSALFIFCADNGVVKEGVSQTGQHVTAQVTDVIGRGESCSAHMGQELGTEVYAIDLGVSHALAGESFGSDGRGEPNRFPALVNRKIRPGTEDFLEQEAMTKEEVLMAVLTGMDCARLAKEAGMDILFGGEMGIGNTTTASAVACALLDADAAEITGKGAGFTEEGLRHKIEVVRRGVEKHCTAFETRKAGVDGNTERNCEKDAMAVLRCVGGLDIAAMTGLYLGAAVYRIPAVMDGFIAAAAALAAHEIAPESAEYLLASHMSGEGGMRPIMERLGKNPPIHAGLHLGEGTGALMLLPLLRMTNAVYRKMMTFDGMGIEAYKPL